jgi:hypothetical protein
LLVPAQRIVGTFFGAVKDYPPPQKAASCGVDQVLEELGSADLAEEPGCSVRPWGETSMFSAGFIA